MAEVGFIKPDGRVVTAPSGLHAEIAQDWLLENEVINEAQLETIGPEELIDAVIEQGWIRFAAGGRGLEGTQRALEDREDTIVALLIQGGHLSSKEVNIDVYDKPLGSFKTTVGEIFDEGMRGVIQRELRRQRIGVPVRRRPVRVRPHRRRR